jgi:thymidylate synthase (FAD)
MELIKPSFEILTPEANFEGMLQRMEAAGRTCYKSEDRITDESAENFIRQRVNKQKHETIIEHESVSVRIICDRGVTHEIVRHRLASYSQESTRYCNYGKIGIRFIVPPWGFTEEDIKVLKIIEDHYNDCLERGLTPQQARYFLPNGLKTEIVMTCNLREWKHFFKLRTAKEAHPQMVEIATPILKEFQKRIPVVFEDL